MSAQPGRNCSADEGPGGHQSGEQVLQFSTPSRTLAAVSVMHVSCTRRTLGGAHFYIARERLRLMFFGRLVLGVSPVAGWPCAIREQSSAACFCPHCGVLLRFFARVLRVINALKPTRGVASKASGWRPSLCCASLAQRRARGHIKRSARAQVGRQSWRTACVLMPGGIHPQLNRAVC